MYFCMSKHSLQLNARESTHQMHVLYNFLLFCPLHYFGLAAKEPEINILHNAEEIITETISGEGEDYKAAIPHTPLYLGKQFYYIQSMLSTTHKASTPFLINPKHNATHLCILL